MLKSRENTLSLEFNPRTLLVGGSPAKIITQDRPHLDAVFIPTRGRSQRIRELLLELPVDDTPIYVLPTSSNDIAGLTKDAVRRVQILSIDDPQFRDILASLKSFSAENAWMAFPDWDLPAKRNYALWYAMREGYSRILLLDDDIRGLTTTHWTAGARALDSYSVAGFFVDDFPDHSDIGHAMLLVGQSVPTFLSGSCLFVRLSTPMSCFPRVYNEDWLFVLPYLVSGSARALGEVRQTPYRPLSNPSVAVFQEFGEIIAGGLFALTLAKRYDDRFTLDAWRDILSLRRRQLLALASSAKLKHKLGVIKGALQQCRRVTAQSCVAFIATWQEDLELWNRILPSGRIGV